MLSSLVYLTLILILVVWLEKPSLFVTNSLIIRKNPGEELEDWLKKFHWDKRSEIKTQGSLPQYKFYSEVVNILLSLARKMGGSYQQNFLFLREGLKLDQQFEKKLKEMILGTWLQMLLMMILTWVFIITALSIVDIKVSGFKLFLILAWQLIGLSCLPLLLRFYRKRFFGDIGILWRMLYVLNGLASVPLSRSEIFTQAGVQDLNHIHQKSLLNIVEKLKTTCRDALRVGGSYEAEVKHLMDELRFQENWHFELFGKRLVAIKLALLSCFFLPSYLSFLFFLLGDLMKMM